MAKKDKTVEQKAVEQPARMAFGGKEWQVEWRDINSLTPYAKNARKNDQTVPYLMNGIKRFGFLVPLVVDKHGVVAAGHTRLKAALQLGWARVPCVVADQLTDAEIKAFRVADNKIAEMSTCDEELLKEELEELAIDFDEDMVDFGFGDPDSAGDEDGDAEGFDDLEENGKVKGDEHTLRLGTISIPLTDEEYKAFMQRYQDYVDANGVVYGFIAEVFGK